MKKIDLLREHKDEYAISREPRIVNVRSGTYLTVVGAGTPDDDEFKKKLGALYACAYTIKFDSKLHKGRDFKVGVLEGLWWTTTGETDPLKAPKPTWRWKLLIRVPAFVTAKDVTGALASMKEKGRPVAAVKREMLREGRAVQALHVGAYADEPKTLEKMAAFAAENRVQFRGKHHEIYLSDPRRVPASRLRTILRHPVSAGRVRGATSA